MVLFHRTAHAQEILANGFRDDGGDRPSPSAGVWLSSGLGGCPDGAEDDAVLILKLPIEVIRPYEQLQVGQTYRTFLVPARVITQYAGRVVARPWTTRGGGSADTARPDPDPVPDEALTHLAARVVDAVRLHLQTYPLDQWPRWMTVATCARYIDRTDAGIRGLVARGAIPFVKPEGLVYFDRFVIDQWMAGKAKAPAQRRRAMRQPSDEDVD